MVNNERDIEEYCELFYGRDEEECKQNVDEVFRQNQLLNGYKNILIIQDFLIFIWYVLIYVSYMYYYENLYLM